MRLGKESRATCSLGHRADIRGDDRTAAGHRLKEWEAERFVERGVHEEVGCLVEAGSLLERHPTDEDDVVGYAKLDGECPQLGRVALVSRSADNDELMSWEFVSRQCPRTQQAVTVLVAPKRRDKEHKWTCDSVEREMGSGGVTVTGFEHGVIDRLGDQPHLPRIHLEESVDLPSQAVGVDDDHARQSGRALVVKPAIGPDARA